VGAFDAQFSEYRHHIDKFWAGPESVAFGGRVQFKMDDGMNREDIFLRQVLQTGRTEQDRQGLCPC